MRTSAAGIKFIQSYESCRLTAYNPTGKEKMWTIGWGHYGVKQGATISQAEADRLFKQDLATFESAVNGLGLSLNQNQFDALVSFSYNCGPGALRELCRGRSLQQIAETMTLYNKGGGKVLAGLVKRRAAEKEMFLRGGGGGGSKPAPSSSKKSISEIAKEVVAGKHGNGEDRKRRLRALGYTDGEIASIQAEVNRLLGAGKTATPKKSIPDVAREVIAGKWGNGEERKRRLRQAGYSDGDIAKIQAEVNRKMK